MNKWLMIHIMKTAGTSLRHYLIRSQPGMVFPQTHEMRQTALGKWYYPPRGFLNLLAENPGMLRRNRFFFGHFNFELINHLPASVKVGVFLRDPIARTISMINHFRKLKPEQFGQASIQELLDNDDFVARYVRDYQTKVFAIDDVDVTPNDPYTITAESFDRSLENLRQCAFIGLTEDMDASLQLFQQINGIDISNRIPVLNRSRQTLISTLTKLLRRQEWRKPLIDDQSTISAMDIERIRWLVPHDLQLYREAVKIHKAQLMRYCNHPDAGADFTEIVSAS